MSGLQPKQTKKQKKAAAFRQRGKPKSQGQETLDIPVQDLDDEDASIPQDLDTDAVPVQEVPTSSEKKKKKAKQTIEDTAESVTSKPSTELPKPKSRKRKRAENEEATPDEGSAETQKETKTKKAQDSESDKNQRLILFVGNLSYTTSVETIRNHFSSCDPSLTVRLLTPKASKTGRASARSKGCAFVEFNNRPAVQKALKLHQSEIEGRQINVELTAGGGGSGEQRMQKLRERNKRLGTQRTNRATKQNKGDQEIIPERPQRYSGTSGQEQIPLKRRTWTIGDQVDDEKPSRKRAKRPKAKEWGTGVNAIPVG